MPQRRAATKPVDVETAVTRELNPFSRGTSLYRESYTCGRREICGRYPEHNPEPPAAGLRRWMVNGGGGMETGGGHLECVWCGSMCAGYFLPPLLAFPLASPPLQFNY
ncbi:hypothetical protein Trydic_g7170 [Trypoxylus dichotomus]